MSDLEPQGSPISDIRQALIQNTLGISTYEPSMKNIIIRLDEAEQAILSIIAEAIGEDEPTQIKVEGGWGTVDVEDDEFYRMDGRNQLRAEIRQKLGIPTAPTK